MGRARFFSFFTYILTKPKEKVTKWPQYIISCELRNKEQESKSFDSSWFILYVLYTGSQRVASDADICGKMSEFTFNAPGSRVPFHEYHK